MDEIRVGIFGVGHRGLSWLRLIDSLDGYRITAVGDIFEPLNERALAQLKDRRGVSTYVEYEDMLADSGIDAIALTVRCKEQGAMAAQALEAGKHVNSEVPAAFTMEDCWRIVVAQERTGLVYLHGDQARYAGFFQAWRDIVHGGQLGRVVYCEGEYIGYPGTLRYHQDWTTGEFVATEDLPSNPNARPTWSHLMDPIYYLPHELSPLLMVLDDRVTRVTAMSTKKPSYAHPEIDRADLQLALMKTEKDAVLRMACGYTQPLPPLWEHHHYQIMGTGGMVQSGRTSRDKAKMWLADSHMHDMADVDWRYERTDAPPEAVSSGHRGADYYVQVAFRDAVLGRQPLEFDVYKGVDTAAPAILAVESIRNGNAPYDVPDFRPSVSRPAGTMPAEI